MSQVLQPATDWEMRSMIADLIDRNLPVEITGAGSKRAIGRPLQTAATLSTSSMRLTTLYEPTELVMSAEAGVPLTQIETELAANGQMLAFEPIDLAPSISGGRAGAQTIGAIFAANLSGARRVALGAARDHLIGVRGVNGRAEAFASGGRVMKNVTGYDVARALTGSWGTLAVLSEVTFKVLPWPEDAVTLVFTDLTDQLANELMCAAMGLPYEISGAVHLPKATAARLEHDGLRGLNTSVTLLRIENAPASVAYRKGEVAKHLIAYGQPLELDFQNTLAVWGELRRLSVMPYSPTCLWRISTAADKGAKLVAALRRHMDATVFYDWSGGLIWFEILATGDAGSSDIRRAVAVHGGHATLIRAAPAVRAAVEVFPPLSPAVERITRGIKHAFDPSGIFNPGRMYANV